MYIEIRKKTEICGTKYHKGDKLQVADWLGKKLIDSKTAKATHTIEQDLFVQEMAVAENGEMPENTKDEQETT